MKISLEIPIRYIEEFLPLTDFPFGLAHLCYETWNPLYSKSYVKQMQGCMMDNSMYELDEPLSIDQIGTAALVCNAKSVIAPDWEGKKNETLKATRQMAKWMAAARWDMDVGGVVQGKNHDEREDCYMEMIRMKLGLICFPFRSPRDGLIERLRRRGLLYSHQRYHLLGMSDIEDIPRYNNSHRFPGRWSIDTAKPFKNIDMVTADKIRGYGKLDLFERLTEYRKMVAYRNIAYFYKLKNL